MIITIVLIIGFVLLILGFAGCFLPVLPGPPLSFIALLLLAITTGFADPLSVQLVVLLGIVAVIAAIADNIIPVLGAKKFGASRWGVWGSIAGLIIGIIFFPPLGLVLGAVVGAVAGEYIAGKTHRGAFAAGFGVIVYSLVAIVMKLVVSAVITFYFIKALGSL